MSLEITEIRLRHHTGPDKSLLAFVTVTLNNVFVVKDVKVINGPQGQFVAMPSRLAKDGTFRDVCHPTNQDTRDYFEQTILEAYEQFKQQPAA